MSKPNSRDLDLIALERQLVLAKQVAFGAGEKCIEAGICGLWFRVVLLLQERGLWRLDVLNAEEDELYRDGVSGD